MGHISGSDILVHVFFSPINQKEVRVKRAGLPPLQSLPLHDVHSVEWLSSPPRRVYNMSIKITNKVFTPALLHQESEEYQTMYKDVNDLVR